MFILMYQFENDAVASINAKFMIFTKAFLNSAVIYYVKSSPVTGLEWPRGFQEVKVPRFHDNGTGWW